MNKYSEDISYARLAILIGSWYFVMDQPEIYLLCNGVQFSMYLLQLITCGDSQAKRESELNKQLRILITRIATSLMIFAIIKQSLDHSYHRDSSPGNIKIGIAAYDEKVDADQAERDAGRSIDSNTQYYCFMMTILFFMDFISVWFDQYSLYFAGERKEQVSNILENCLF